MTPYTLSSLVIFKMCQIIRIREVNCEYQMQMFLSININETSKFEQINLVHSYFNQSVHISIQQPSTIIYKFKLYLHGGTCTIPAVKQDSQNLGSNYIICMYVPIQLKYNIIHIYKSIHIAQMTGSWYFIFIFIYKKVCVHFRIVDIFHQGVLIWHQYLFIIDTSINLQRCDIRHFHI